MDDDKRFAINILPSVKIPQDQNKFQAYLDKVVNKTDNNGSKKPCVLQELIDGVKFAVNVICKNGRILTLQVKFLSKLYIYPKYYKTEKELLTLIGMRGDTSISLYCLDHILSAQFL